jgi:hypothetical protein
MGTDTDMNFYPQVWVQIFTYTLFANGWIITLPNSNPTSCYSYSAPGFQRLKAFMLAAAVAFAGSVFVSEFFSCRVVLLVCRFAA